MFVACAVTCAPTDEQTGGRGLHPAYLSGSSELTATTEEYWPRRTQDGKHTLCRDLSNSASDNHLPDQHRPRMRLQRSSQRLRRRVQHVHFSGCAGTSVRMFVEEELGVHVSQRNGPNGNEGCSSTQVDWVDAAREGSSRCACKDHWDYEWQASENPPMVPLGCSGVDYWVVLREPVSRVVSRVYKHGWDIQFVKAALRETIWLERSECYELSGSATLSNYYVRGLAGPGAFRRGLNGINETHYEAAYRALKRFKVVLPLSNLSSLPVLLGLPATVKVPEEVTGHHSEVPTTPDTEMVRLLQMHNGFDARLFADAERLFERALDRALFQDSHPSAARELSDIQTCKLKRFDGNPLISNSSFGKAAASEGANINFPSILVVPSWLPERRSAFYLYFGHHSGEYIRLALADRVEGPWRLHHGAHVLSLSDAKGCDKHVDSPSVHVDEQRRRLLLLFHCVVPGRGQLTFVAASTNGLRFTMESKQPVGPFYMRPFWWRHALYAVGKDKKNGGVLLRADGHGAAMWQNWKQLPGLLPDMRHGCAWPRTDAELYLFFTLAGGAPESILYTRLNMSAVEAGSEGWVPHVNEAKVLLEPEMDYEGGELASSASAMGAAHGFEKALRDPVVIGSGDRPYGAHLLYVAGGENSIAGGLLRCE